MTASAITTPDTTSEQALRLLAIVVIAAIVPALLMMGPVVAGQLAIQFNMSAGDIGLLFMSELGAMSLATLPALYWLSRFNLKKASLVFGLMFIAANIMSIWADSNTTLTFLRIFSGFTGGSLTVICIVTASTFDKPDRAYGFWVLGQLLLGAIGLTLLPRLFSVYGLEVFFTMLAVLMMFCLPLMRFLPSYIHNNVSVSEKSLWSLKPLFGLTAVLLFYISLNGTWTFMGALASEAGIEAQVSGDILAIATLFGIVGAVIATFIGGRWAYKMPLVLGYMIMLVSIISLLGEPDILRYTVAAFAFKFAWTFALPFILASLAQLDRSGKIMNLSNLVIGCGLALGPMLAGRVIDVLSKMEPFLYIAMIMTIISLLLILSLQKNEIRTIK